MAISLTPGDIKDLSSGFEGKLQVNNSPVVCFGEVLIDFVPTVGGVSLAEAPAFKKAPGGAPANVAVGISRLGGSSAFIGKVGDDEFGYMLVDILKQNNVDCSGVRFDPNARTALAFVTLRADGEREFLFFRHPSADMLLTERELEVKVIEQAKIFHYGSISLIDEPSKSAHLAALKLAKNSGCLLSYDPNLRLPLWPSPEAARDGIMSIWDQADIVKISEDEITFLTGGDDPYDDNVVLKKLFRPNFKLLIVTEGSQGCRYYTRKFRGRVAGIKAKPVDTTGAGDAFVSGILFRIASDLSIWQGMAPGAHIAVYKVCWFSGCYSSDIVAAMDSAIKDGVDILSLSLGGFPLPFFDDSIAIGSFRAMQHGISVVCAAGNNGPTQSSVANVAPWITTIGAGTLDRRFPAIVQLSNGETIYGESMYPGNKFKQATKELEVVYLTGGQMGGELCLKGSLPREQVQGKMVVCDRGVNGRSEKGQIVKESGGAAMILANSEINLEEDLVDVHVLPATLIGFAEANRLKSYINTTTNPKARIQFGGTVIGRSRAPSVAQFSSRGPSLSNPSTLKPDVIAPGVNIIAAWPQNLGPTGLPDDSRSSNFTVMSGTSMACPHVSGIAALIHSVHPNWTPAAIKSAIMTTADVTDHFGKPILDGNNKPAGVFAMGAGHVNPTKAIDPGLIYDIKPYEYIIHLCALGYTHSEIFIVTHMNVSCHKVVQMNKGFTLNYPSMSVIFKHGTTSKMVSRRLTNVGTPNSIYKVEVAAPEGVRVRVKPRRLVFKHVNQSLNYKVWFTSEKGKEGRKVSSTEGHLTWLHSENSKYKVRSPIVVTWKN